MSYKLFSIKTSSDHSLMQWEARSLEGELESFKGRTLVRIFKTYLGKSRTRILEGGCGLGAWCEWFQQENHEILGVEHDQNIINRAKEFKEDVAIEYGDITSLKHADNSFDAYISLGVIEHFEHGPEEAVSEAFRILKPGGLAFFSTPLLTPLRKFFSHPIRDIYFF